MNLLRTFVVLTLFAVTAAGAQPGPSPDQSLHAYLQSRFNEDRSTDPDAHYVLAWADLNGDGQSEALVYLISSNYCGSGGCDLLIFTPAGRSWRQVAEISIVNPPIRLLGTRSRGWRDISVRVAGGGIRGHDALLAFNGRTYPDNPSGPPARWLRGTMSGRVLISDDDRGRPLF